MKNAGHDKATGSRWIGVVVLLLIILIIGLGVFYGTRPSEAPAPSPQAASAPSEAPTYADKKSVSVSALSSPYSHAAQGNLSICSFNIQFLGSSKDRDNDALASILNHYDLVVIQELVAPPYPGVFPNGERYKPDPESKCFFDAMKALGFDYILSEEDTGTGDTIHSNGTNTEWFVAFFRANRVRRAADLPSGFLAEDRSNNKDYERVPYAFAFRTTSKTLDFVLISVHLQPTSGPANRARRKHELASIATWINRHNEKEKDFIILGDMNIDNAAELADDTPPGLLSLNYECRPTNTNCRDPKPYDHIMFNPRFTVEIDRRMDVVNLVEAMRGFWHQPGDYPGDPYNHDEFRKHYSDHCPVVFQMMIPEVDDD